MSEATFDDLDDFRGYTIQKMTTIIEADQGDIEKIEFIASHPQTTEIKARALTLKELKEKVAALPQCYIWVCEYLMQLTHEFTGERDIIVNFFTEDGNSVLGVDKLPRDSTNDDIRRVLPEDCELDTPELAEVLALVRTPPTRTK